MTDRTGAQADGPDQPPDGDSDPSPGGDGDLTTDGGQSLHWFRDLFVVGLSAVLAAAVVLVPGFPWPVVWLVGLPLLVFLPGYAVLSALFPEASGTGGSGLGPRSEQVPDWPTRVVLSVPTSVVLVAVVGAVLAVFGALTPFAAVGAVGVLTLVGVTVATARRERLHPSVRAAPLTASDRSIRPFLPGNRRQTATALLALLLLVGTAAFVGATPVPGDGYTEFYVGTEQPDGEIVAAGFPETITAGTGTPLSFVVENHERRRIDYSVVVLAQRVGPDGGVTDTERVATFSATVRPGERVVLNRTVAPTLTGESIRLRFLLYEGPPPESPSAGNADLSLRLWIGVESGGG